MMMAAMMPEQVTTMRMELERKSGKESSLKQTMTMTMKKNRKHRKKTKKRSLRPIKLIQRLLQCCPIHRMTKDPSMAQEVAMEVTVNSSPTST